jgi:4-amino-4-deoxy-L-arabinose transferase-like glycosyltransferase
MALRERVWDLLRHGWPLLVLALVVRVAQIAVTPGFVPVDDPADYVRHAVSIAHGDGYPVSGPRGFGPTAVRPPAYPYFLAGVFAVSGDSETAGRLASALLGVLTVGLAGLVAQMLWTRRVALITMAIAAVYPPLVLISGTLLSEALALPLLLGVLVCVLAARDAPRKRPLAATAGVLFGLALLDRPALWPLAVPIVLGLWRRGAGGPRGASLPALALAVAALTVTPWTIRNAHEFHAFVPISDQAGYFVGGTYNEAADRDPVLPGTYRPVSFAPSMRAVLADRSLDENEAGRKLLPIARRYARDHPGYVVRVIVLNGLRMAGLWQPILNAKVTWEFQGVGAGWAKSAVVAFWIVAALALAGLLLGAFRGAPAWMWLTPLLLYAGIIWIAGDLRYRLPIEPFVIWPAAYAIGAVWEKRRSAAR